MSTTETLRKLAGNGYLYLATVYSRHPQGTEQAYRDACQAAAWCVTRQIGVFSPIAYTHGVAVHGGIPLTDHAIWLPADRPLMDAARGLAVLMMPGWLESIGIAHEIGVFRDAGKPIVYLTWPLPEE